MPDALPPVAYETVIMVEPALIAPECYDQDPELHGGQLKTVAEGVLKRRSTWDNRAQAAKYIRKRFPYSMWDPRVVDLYIVCGGLPDTRVLIRTNAESCIDRSPRTR